MGKGRITGNISILVTANMMSQGCLFLASLYLARTLGPESFGRVSFAATFAAFFVIFTDCGLTLYGIREASCNPKSVNMVVRVILRERIVLATLSFGLLAGITLVINKPSAVRLLILFYGLGAFPAALLIEWAFQGLEQFRIVAFGRFVTGIIYLLLVILFVQSPSQEMIPPLAWIATGFIVSLFLGYIFFRAHGKPAESDPAYGFLSLTRKTFPMGLSLIMIQIVYTIDSVMLGFLGSDADVGVYAAVYKIILALVLVGAVYFESVFPLMSRLCIRSHASFIALHCLNLKIVSAFIAPLFIAGIICGELLINFLFGRAYSSGLSAYVILLLSVVLIYYNMLYARGLWAFNKQNIFLVIVTFQSVINISLNMMLIPKYGINGAATSTLIAELVGLVMYYRYLGKIVSIQIEYNNLIPFVLVACMFLIYKAVDNVIVIFPLLIAYITILYVIKFITRDEMLVYDH